MSLEALQTIWFGLIAILWIGYFFLEGFDFGVGMLLPVVGHGDVERRMVIKTIGPVWDGNEVWLITAGGATFAAFPVWYATLFSGFYLALFLILVALILRGVAFEFRNQRSSPRWRANWDRALVFGSAVPAVLWGVAFANIVHGVPINSAHDYTGTLLDLLNPYALVGGVAMAGLFLLHGAVFLTLKLSGEPLERAEKVARRLSWPVAVLMLIFLGWTFVNAVNANDTGIVPSPVPVTALVLLGVVGPLLGARLNGWAFVCTGLAVALTVLTLFLNLYPHVLVSSTDPANSLTIHNASSTAYTLGLMTIVALVFTPIVLLYQAWTYWVFRQRITAEEFQLPGLLRSSKPSSDHT
jgi:cytochrome bd ubiquinol oxidase subunit II